MWYGHIVKPWYNISGIISTSGRALDWIKDAAGGAGQSYSEFFSSLSPVPAGARKLLFLPYLAGERAPLWDPDARGAFIGLGLHHGKAEMVRAVLESVGFAIRDVIEVMAENGGTVRELRITGGPGKSGLWNQIKADITGTVIRVPESPEPVLLGNLVLGITALDAEAEAGAVSDAVVRISREFLPDYTLKPMYDDLFALYRQSYQALKQVFARLAAVTVQEDV